MNVINLDGRKAALLTQVKKLRNIIIKEFDLYRKLKVDHEFIYGEYVIYLQGNNLFVGSNSAITIDGYTHMMKPIHAANPTQAAWIIVNEYKFYRVENGTFVVRQ